MALHLLLSAAVIGMAGLLAACGSSPGTDDGTQPGSGEAPPRVPVAASRAGRIYRQEIPVAATGDTMVVQVFEPTRLQAGKTYPLVLEGHGYGGSRHTEPSGMIQRLIDAGYYVISIDQRGFGESSGTVRVMSPDQDGPDLIAILDWAENLEGLRRRSNGEMQVGSYGSSYGGMYQLLLWSADPKHRLRVLAPDITPHDLTYALGPNEVVKSGWGLALVGGAELPLVDLLTGDSSALPATLDAVLDLVQRGHLRQDRAVYETVLTAAISNRFADAGSNFLRYHSMRYFCDGQPAGAQDFRRSTPDPLQVLPAAPPPADVLLTQGFRDTLFNFNEAAHNYDCLKALGGDVRLLTHQSGHILPLSPQALGLEGPLDPFYYALTLPGFQDAGGTRRCGTLDLDAVLFAWFEDKLQDRKGAIDTALSTGRDVCVSLAENDAIQTHEVRRGGTSFPIGTETPQLNSLLGVVGSLLGNGLRDTLLLADPVLYTVPAGGAVLAGIPTLQLTLSRPSGRPAPEECRAPLLAVHLGCDPILFLALGHRPPGQQRWDLIDDQITPVRGFGSHTLDMNGVAERLATGEEVALLIYGFHLQFPITWSRDLLVPAVRLDGSVALPLLNPAEIVRDGV